MITAIHVQQALRIIARPQHPGYVASATRLLSDATSLNDLWDRYRSTGEVTEVWTIAAVAWHIGHSTPATDPLQSYSAAEIIVGPGGQTLAEAAADAPELEPGWEDRAVERARREGVLP